MAQCRPPDKLCYRRFSIPIWAKRRKPCIQIGFQRAAYAIASLSATVCLVSRRVIRSVSARQA